VRIRLIPRLTGKAVDFSEYDGKRRLVWVFFNQVPASAAVDDGNPTTAMPKVSMAACT